MDLIWQKFTEWLKELLVSGIMDNVNGLFDNVNSRVAGIAFEPQFPPNEIHYAAHPATILRAGETFRTETVYVFDTE